jgi:hypothetical protein
VLYAIAALGLAASGLMRGSLPTIGFGVFFAGYHALAARRGRGGDSSQPLDPRNCDLLAEHTIRTATRRMWCIVAIIAFSGVNVLLGAAVAWLLVAAVIGGVALLVEWQWTRNPAMRLRDASRSIDCATQDGGPPGLPPPAN